MDSERAQQADPRVGTVLADKYRIHRLIGRGGMGSVYEAEHVSLGKRVALKFLDVGPQTDETSLARFQREARAISAVESTHIVQVFDWGQDEAGLPYLVMELLDGRDLGAEVRQQGRLELGEAVRFAIEALRGLRRVHAAGIVHRDLKPENLFLVMGDDDKLHVKIVDFGLSKLVENAELAGPAFVHNSRLTQAGAVIGTPLYMSPEQIEGVDDTDHRADLWAIGAILYEALAGQPPFMGRSYARLVMAICQQDPPDLCKSNEAVPRELELVIRRAMNRDRAARFQDADEFVAALAPFRQLGTAVPAPRPSTPRAAAAQTPLGHEAGKGGAGGPGQPAVLGPSDASKAAAAQEPRRGTPRSVRPTPVPDTPALPNLAARVAAADAGRATPKPIDAAPARASERPTPAAPADAGALDATLAAHTRGAATVWLADVPAFSLWRGEVDSPDRLRIETRDGSVRDLRLEPVGSLALGRVERVGAERNDLVYPDVASRLAARLHHDGVRWWLERREECSVPVQVGTRTLNRGERAPLVHGTVVTVGAMRATVVDRRYVSRSVPAGTVDPLSGLLGRGGLEQELATALAQRKPAALQLLHLGRDAEPAEHPASVRVAVALHKSWPSAVVSRDEDIVALVMRGTEPEQLAHAERARQVAEQTGARVLACGYWQLEGDPLQAAGELELALDAIVVAGGPAAARLVPALAGARVVPLRAVQGGVRLSSPDEVLERARSPKNQLLLFAIEEQAALERIGPAVVTALEQELGAVLGTQLGPAGAIAKLAPGVVAASVPRKIDASSLAVAVQCEWHARPPITDGKVELPRTLSWEEAMADAARQRAAELARECADAHGVLSALSGGLPYPIAGRVHAAISASSAVERVKMLFDVLEGTWRLIAAVLAAAYFSKARVETGDHSAIRTFHEKVKTRAGLPLGSWRELARIAAKGFEGADDPIGRLARQLLDVRLGSNQTFDTLSSLMHTERNSFAHGHYTEARAAADVREFEQMTRTFLRALRPLCAWTLVTVQRTEPDLYGEFQTVDFVDHTGPYAAGARRRIGFNSPIRLANVVYLTRWRDGLVLPLEPFIRHLAAADRYDLYWMDHLPRAGACTMSGVVSGRTVQSACDTRRLPPLLRGLVEGTL